MTAARNIPRWIAAIVCLLLLIQCATIALAETAVVNNPDPTDRLNLRDDPSSKGNILRKYYNGVEAEILSTTGDWSKVRIGSAEGYMQTKFLETGGAASSVQSACPMGGVDVTYPQTKLALRERESDDSTAVGSYESGTVVTILGASDGWLHVRVNDDGRTGFMRSAWITQTENEKYAAVNSDKATLRVSPKADGKSLGVYPKGVSMKVLFSFEKLEGWERVRIGDTVGFMRASEMAYNQEPGLSTYEPAVKIVSNKDSYANLRETASSDASVKLKLEDGTSVTVIGTAGDWTHVQVNDLYGYVQSKFLK